MKITNISRTALVACIALLSASGARARYVEEHGCGVLCTLMHIEGASDAASPADSNIQRPVLVDKNGCAVAIHTQESEPLGCRQNDKTKPDDHDGPEINSMKESYEPLEYGTPHTPDDAPDWTLITTNSIGRISRREGMTRQECHAAQARVFKAMTCDDATPPCLSDTDTRCRIGSGNYGFCRLPFMDDGIADAMCVK